MNKKQFEYLKEHNRVEYDEDDAYQKKLGLETDDLLGWFRMNADNEIDVFDSPGLDIECFIFERKGEVAVVIYYY